jgi:uncharacterized membrane protein SpoIIM required for sporulation
VFFAIFLFSNIPTFGINFCLLENILLVAYNGLALGAVGDFGAQNCQYTTKVDAT